MPFVPEKLGPDARRNLERAFFACVAVFVIVGVALPISFAHAGVETLINYVLLIIVYVLEWLINTIGLLVLLLVDVIINVASYNDFKNAVPVETGWVLVRDVVNMFFIVVLLITAFSTIIQYSKFDYKKILPKLLLMAVLVNFSRLLIGLLIDFSQVIMLTFVNGFKAAAAGNFVQALKLDKILAISTTRASLLSPGDVANTSEKLLLQVLMAEMLGMFMLGVTLITLTIMVLFLIVRVVGLWMALIMSPAAFFASAVESVSPLKDSVAFITGSFWQRLGSLLSGGPIMAFFLWLTLATVQEGGFAGFKEESAVRAGEIAAKQGEYFITLVGNNQEFGTFLVAIMMLLMGVEAAVKVSSQVSSTLGKTAGKINDYGMRATRFAAYGGMLAGGAYAAKGARGIGRWGVDKVGLQPAIEQSIGKKIQTLGVLTGVAGVAKYGGGLRKAQSKRVEAAQKIAKEQRVGMKQDEKLRSLESAVAGGFFINAAEKEASLRELHKEKTSLSGKVTLKKRFTDEAEAAGYTGDDAKGYVNAKMRADQAASWQELEKLAKETNDDELKKQTKEAFEKDPTLLLDSTGVNTRALEAMDDVLAGGASHASGKLKADALGDSRMADRVIGNMLGPDGKVNAKSDWFKHFATGESARAQYTRERLETLQGLAGPSGDLRSVIGREPMEQTRYSDGRNVHAVHPEIVRAARTSPPPGVGAPPKRTPRDNDRIKVGQEKLKEARTRSAPSAEIRQLQRQMTQAGASIPETYKLDATGRFVDPSEGERFKHNMQEMVTDGATNPSIYAQTDLGYLQKNLSGSNQARSTFAAAADLTEMSAGWNAAAPDSLERHAIEDTVHAVHHEGSRVRRMLEEHNAANEEGKKVKNQVDIAAIIAVAEMNDHAMFENVTNKVKNRITMEEAKAMAKKETIDHDAVLRNFRETASSRAEQAHKNAAAPTP